LLLDVGGFEEAQAQELLVHHHLGVFLPVTVNLPTVAFFTEKRRTRRTAL